jgi:hypothetical protein
MNWKQLYATAQTRDGALHEIARRGVVAAQASGQLGIIRRLTVRRDVLCELPLYALCATLDAYGIEAPNDVAPASAS